jgi:hypothetical protein
LPNDIDALLVSACRTPIGSFGGALKDLSAADLGAIAIREAIVRAKVTAADLDDVLMGCVLQAGAGMNVARQAALKAGVPVEVPAETINRVCGSGLQAVFSGRCAQRLRAHHRRRWNRIDVERAVSPQRRAMGLPDGQRRSHRLDVERRPHVRDQLVPHGDDRRRSG